MLLRVVHGLGDTVQFGVVLKHLRRHRPNWEVTVRCGRGKHTALEGLCHRVCHDQEADPAGPFQTQAMLAWNENYNHYGDRPNTKVTNCLAEVFGLGWDPDLGHYEIRLPAPVRQRVADYYQGIGAVPLENGKWKVVVLHYEGNTSPWKKNLKHYQAQGIIQAIRAAGRLVLLLDWDGRSPLPDGREVICPRVGENDLWGGFGSGDAATIAALVQAAEAYVGVDSGPGKCASATKTPCLICWHGHHPMQFHDPCPTTTHLIPHTWRELSPCGNPAVAACFERLYRFETFTGGETGLVEGVRQWLERTLEQGTVEKIVSFPYVLPRGIGDTTWALLKLRQIAGDNPVDVILGGGGDLYSAVEQRTVPFLRRFPWIRSVQVLDVPILREGPCNDEQGRYRYVHDGVRNNYCYLIPNTVLEQGRRIEEWQPQVSVDWDVVDTFSWEGTQKGYDLVQELKPFVALYLGPEAGNVDSGHNRGFLWEPRHWVELAKSFQARGLRIAVVGAEYDRSYWERYCREGFQQVGIPVCPLLGTLEIGETFRFLRGAELLVSYQSGLAIFGHYLGIRCVSWWRAEGDSQDSGRLVSFDERMKDAWIRPGWEDRWLGLVYGRETPEQIYAEIERRGWLP